MKIVNIITYFMINHMIMMIIMIKRIILTTYIT